MLDEVTLDVVDGVKAGSSRRRASPTANRYLGLVRAIMLPTRSIRCSVVTIWLRCRRKRDRRKALIPLQIAGAGSRNRTHDQRFTKRFWTYVEFC